MAWNAPVAPVSGTVITVAWATSNVVDTQNHLRLMTGNADPPGSNYVVRSTSTTATAWSKINGDMLEAGSISTTQLADGGISLAKMAINSVNTPQLVDDAVTESKIADGVIVSSHFSAGAVDAAAIATNAVDTPELKDDAVTGSKIADGVLVASHFSAGAVGTAAIAADAVTNNEIADGTIVAGNIANGTITNAKLAAGVAAANLGFTPVNRAGDTGISGNLDLANVTAIRGKETGGTARNLVYMGSDNRVTIGDDDNDVRIFAGADPKVNVGGVDYAFVYEDNLADYLPAVGAYVPSGVIAAFRTAAAIASGWSRFTDGDGRLLVGAGTVFSTTWTQDTAYGSSWGHVHSSPSHTHSTPAHQHTSLSLSVSGSATGGPSDKTGTASTKQTNKNVTSGAGSEDYVPDHDHSLNGVGLAVSGTATGNSGTDGSGTSGSASGDANTGSTSWVIPSRAVVWAIKS